MASNLADAAQWDLLLDRSTEGGAAVGGEMRLQVLSEHSFEFEKNASI